MSFEFSIDEEAGFPVVCPEGSLIEKHQAEDLLEEINELLIEGSNRIIIDLSKLNYLNSSGLGVILSILTRTSKAGGEVVISGVNDRLNNLIVITKLDAVFQFSKNRSEAAERLKSTEHPNQKQ